MYPKVDAANVTYLPFTYTKFRTTGPMRKELLTQQRFLRKCESAFISSAVSLEMVRGEDLVDSSR